METYQMLGKTKNRVKVYEELLQFEIKKFSNAILEKYAK